MLLMQQRSLRWLHTAAQRVLRSQQYTQVLPESCIAWLTSIPSLLQAHAWCAPPLFPVTHTAIAGNKPVVDVKDLIA